MPTLPTKDAFLAGLANHYPTIAEAVFRGQENCTICHEPIRPVERLYLTPCQHVFCLGCAQEWLKSNNTCPTCRRELYELPEPIIEHDESEWETDDSDDSIGSIGPTHRSEPDNSDDERFERDQRDDPSMVPREIDSSRHGLTSHQEFERWLQETVERRQREEAARAQLEEQRLQEELERTLQEQADEQRAREELERRLQEQVEEQREQRTREGLERRLQEQAEEQRLREELERQLQGQVEQMQREEVRQRRLAELEWSYGEMLQRQRHEEVERRQREEEERRELYELQLRLLEAEREQRRRLKSSDFAQLDSQLEATEARWQALGIPSARIPIDTAPTDGEMVTATANTTSARGETEGIPNEAGHWLDIYDNNSSDIEE